jgi:protein phosphatase
MANFFRKIFGPRRGEAQPPAVEITTRPLKPGEVEQLEEAASSESAPAGHLMAASAQSVGMQRDHNEDALFALTTLLSGDGSSLPFGLYIVADGMGGHSHGEVASSLAVRAMASYILRKLYAPLLSVKPSPPGESIQEILRQGMLEAHQAITRDAPGGGTTLTAVLILGDQMTLVHVGDSRAYRIQLDLHLESITRDHSLVKRLVELGQLTVEEAAVHPQRNVLYRALGQGEPFEADISTSPLPEAGYLLLCSDGLWGVITEKDIIRILRETPGLAAAVQRMVDEANEAGGPDNITAILIRLPG